MNIYCFTLGSERCSSEPHQSHVYRHSSPPSPAGSQYQAQGLTHSHFSVVVLQCCSVVVQGCNNIGPRGLLGAQRTPAGSQYWAQGSQSVGQSSAVLGRGKQQSYMALLTALHRLKEIVPCTNTQPLGSGVLPQDTRQRLEQCNTR